MSLYLENGFKDLLISGLLICQKLGGWGAVLAFLDFELSSARKSIALGPFIY